MLWKKIYLAAVVMMLVTAFSVGSTAQDVVPAEQWLVVVGVNAGDGAEFPPAATVWYHLDVHNAATPATWTTVADTIWHTGAGDTMRVSWDIPKDGQDWQYRSVPTVDWGDGTVEVAVPCLSPWRRARRVEGPSDGCGWLNR